MASCVAMESLESTKTPADEQNIIVPDLSSTAELILPPAEALDGSSASYVKSAYQRKKIHTCELCHKSYNNQSSLVEHIRVHTGERPYNCHLCPNQYSGIRNLRRHLRSHSGVRPFRCDMCQKHFSSKSSLSNHYRTHTGEKPYTCPSCQKGFSLRPDLVKHLRVHTGEKPFVCKVCGKGFKQSGHLSAHMYIHDVSKQFMCEVCQKLLSTKASLAVHVKTHSGEKPYECELCQRAFLKSSQLLRHMNVHEKAKQYYCNDCQKLFTDKSATVHLKTIHTGEKTICKFCNKQFASTYSYQPHTQMGEKLYVCPHCPMRFRGPSGLHKHKSAHSGQKQFRCDNCQKEFRYESHFKKHTLACSVRPENFYCNFCEKKYLAKKTLNTHVRICHGAVNRTKPVDNDSKKCPDELSVNVEPGSEKEPSHEETLMACKLLDRFYSIKNFPCTFCKKICPSQRILNRHIMICHSKMYPENPAGDINEKCPDVLSVKVEPDSEI